MQLPRASPSRRAFSLAFLIVTVALLGALLLGTHSAQASDVPATADHPLAITAADVDPGFGTEATLPMSLANADIDVSASTAFDDLIATDGAGLYATVTLLAAVLLISLASFLLITKRRPRPGLILSSVTDPPRWNLVGQLLTLMHRTRDLTLGMGRVAQNP